MLSLSIFFSERSSAFKSIWKANSNFTNLGAPEYRGPAAALAWLCRGWLLAEQAVGVTLLAVGVTLLAAGADRTGGCFVNKLKGTCLVVEAPALRCLGLPLFE